MRCCGEGDEVRGRAEGPAEALGGVLQEESAVGGFAELEEEEGEEEGEDAPVEGEPAGEGDGGGEEGLEVRAEGGGGWLGRGLAGGGEEDEGDEEAGNHHGGGYPHGKPGVLEAAADGDEDQPAENQARLDV